MYVLSLPRTNPARLTQVTFRNVQRQSIFAQVAVEFMQEIYDKLYMYVKGSPVEIQSPRYWNLIGSRMNAPPSVLPPSSILPPPSSYFAFFPAKKISAYLPKMLFYNCLYFLKISCLKLLVSNCFKSENVCIGFSIGRSSVQ